MTHSAVTLPNHYILQIVELIESAGIETAPWLRHLGIAPDKAEESLIAMPWQVFRQFMLDARRFTRDDSLGLMIGERLLINAHGVLGYAAMSSATTRQVVALIEQYLVLRTDLLAMESQPEGDVLLVRFHENRPLEDIRRPVTEAVLLAIRNILDFTTMGSCDIRAVTFPFPGDRTLAESLFRCPVAYEATCASLSLPLATIDKPLRMANAVSYQQALKTCRQELDKLPTEQTWSSRIRRLLLQSRHGFPSLDMAARRFHMTPRTLHRRLIDEGTSYRALLDSVRHQLAIRYLTDGHMSIQEIAYILGYSDMASFRKAFKRWEAMPPSLYPQR